MSLSTAGTRTQPVRLLRSDLTGRVYAVTRYRDLGDGGFEAIKKHDVTTDFEAIVRFLSDEFNKAKEG